MLILSGIFVNKEALIDLLIVGQIDKDKLENYLNNELETSRPIKFSIMSKEDYQYRQKCNDKFLADFMQNPDNIVSINNLE